MTQGLLIQTSPSTGGQPPQGVPRWQFVGSVQSIHSRAAQAPAPRRRSEVDTVAGYGVVGDRHACAHSPRQILIAGNPAYERFGLPAATLRENVRINFSTVDLRSGDLLRIGPDVVLWLTFHCEPCKLLERRQPGTIKSIGRHRGMLARVLRGGSFSVGSDVSLASAVLPAMSDDWKTRVLGVAATVPPGYCIDYRQLAEMAGVAKAYCRAFPKVLSGLPAAVSGRVVRGASAFTGPRWNGAELFNVARYLDQVIPEPCLIDVIDHVHANSSLLSATPQRHA